MNVGNSCGTPAGASSFIERVRRKYPEFDAIFISELDAIADYHSTTHLGLHAVRHWPGPGSHAMAFDFGSNCVVRDVRWRGRCGMAHISVRTLANSTAEDIFCLGVHAPHNQQSHDEFIADVLSLTAERPKSSRLVLMGDFNHDLLHKFKNGYPQFNVPWRLHHFVDGVADQASAEPRQANDDEELLQKYQGLLQASALGRTSDEELERWQQIEGITTANRLELHVPSPSEHSSGGSFGPLSNRLPISRIPLGDQAITQNPTLLDYCFSSKETIATCELDWEVSPADHAAVVATSTLKRSRRKFQPTSWRPESDDECVVWIRANLPENFATVDTLTEFLLIVQDNTKAACQRAARATNRIPFAIRELWTKVRATTNDRDRAHLRRQAVQLQRIHRRTSQRRDARQLLNSAQGAHKGDKLHTVKAMRLFHTATERNVNSMTYDREVWSAETKKEFSQRWKSDQLQRKALLHDFMVRTEGADLQITLEEVFHALDIQKHSYRLDATGVSPYAVRLMARVAPDYVAEAIGRLLSSRNELEQQIILAAGKGKDSSVTPSTKMRAIFVLPSLLQLGDTILSTRLSCTLKRIFQPIPGFFEGAVFGTQTTDIAHGISLCLEKGGDLHGAASAAQGDVKSHYDQLDLIKIANWLEHQGADVGVINATLRLHCHPQVHLKVGNVTVSLQPRTCGAHTGTRSAGQFGRIPVADTFRRIQASINNLGFRLQHFNLLAASWVDNIYSLAHSAVASTAIIDQFDRTLQAAWGQELKTGSRSYIAINDDDRVNDIRWKRVDLFSCLGHFIHKSGTPSAAFRKVRGLLWHSFHKKFRPEEMQLVNVQRRMDLLDQHIAPVLTSRSTTWPPTETLISSIDKLQNRITASVFRFVPDAEEEPAAFHRRRMHIASTLVKAHGRWTTRMLQRTVQWNDHVERQAGTTWASALLQYHDDNWLMRLRANFAPSNSSSTRVFTVLAGRTGTRGKAGRPAQRWTAGVRLAKYELLLRDNEIKKKSREKAFKRLERKARKQHLDET